MKTMYLNGHPRRPGNERDDYMVHIMYICDAIIASWTAAFD